MHPTASSLDSHAVEPGQRFSVYARKGKGMQVGDMALFNAVAQIYKILFRVLRVFQIEVPEEISNEFATLTKVL